MKYKDLLNLFCEDEAEKEKQRQEQLEELLQMRQVSGTEIGPQKAATKVAAFCFICSNLLSVHKQSWRLFLAGTGFAIFAGLIFFRHAFPRFCPQCEKEMDEKIFFGLEKEAYVCRKCKVYSELRDIPND